MAENRGHEVPLAVGTTLVRECLNWSLKASLWHNKRLFDRFLVFKRDNKCFQGPFSKTKNNADTVRRNSYKLTISVIIAPPLY